MEKLTLMELEHKWCEIAYMVGKTNLLFELENKQENIEFAIAKKIRIRHTFRKVLFKAKKNFYM